MSEYPKMLYAGDGQYTVVGDEDEEKDALGAGYGTDPTPFYASKLGYVAPEPAEAEPSAAPRRGRPPKSE